MANDSDVMQKLWECHRLINLMDFDSALILLDEVLDEDPNNAPALNFSGYIALKKNNDTVAYQYLKRAIQQDPLKPPVWGNFALSAQHLGRQQEALDACAKSVQLDPNYALGYANMASCLIGMSRWDEAEKAALMALEINPNDPISDKNLGHIYLAQHRWKEGWEHWENSIGAQGRKEYQYADEDRWDGRKNQAVVVYGEQGLGDEIMYASCVPDLIRDSKKVIMDVDKRLEGLFRRSFPKANVYGTRKDKVLDWLDDARIDARVSIAQLPQFYRQSDDDFPGTPYLKADPDKVLMWKALWEKLDKPVVGICSVGGAKYSNARGREIKAEAWESLFAQDCIFVSLDYRDGVEHPKLRQYPNATRCPDYDDTAALIASLDCVVGVVTTAMHCANALGVKTHVLVPKWHQWRYAGDRYVWSKTATLYKQQEGDSWTDVIKRVKL